MTNIDKFNEISAIIFTDLYESFPIAKKIKLDDDYPEFDKEHIRDIFFDTIKFYLHEGFMKCQGEIYYGYTGLTLTSKGFTVLNAPLPESFNDKNANIISKLKKELKTQKPEIIKSLVSALVKTGVSLMMTK